MSEVTKPIALDESFNTTGQTPKNIADVIKNGLQEVAQAIDSHQGGECARKADLTNLDLTGTTNTTGSTIASGTYFYLNGTLVRAKTAIASGATFTLNTNYEVVTVGGLNDIYSRSVRYTRASTSDGRYYTFHFAQPSTRTGVLAVLTSQSTTGVFETIPIALESSSLAVRSKSSRVVDNGDGTFTIDAGSSAWSSPIIFFPSNCLVY